MHCREVLRRDCALQVCIKLRAPTPEAMRRDPAATMVLASSCGRRSGKQVFRQGAETAPGFVGKTANDHATRWRVALSFSLLQHSRLPLPRLWRRRASMPARAGHLGVGQ